MMGDSILRTSASTMDVYRDENCNASTFSSMTQAFSQRISELQQLVCFRVEDSVKHIFVRDMQGIEQNVRALEQLFEDIKQRTQQEMSALPKARSLLQVAQIQQQHLQSISSNLPQHLPSSCSAQVMAQASIIPTAKATTAAAGVRGLAATAAASNTCKADGRGDTAANKGQDRRRNTTIAAAALPAAAPRWYVTAGEIASVPSYMKGRLTLDKVNAALDEVAGFAEANNKSMIAVARHQLGRMGAEERQRLHGLYHGVASKDGVKGRYWFPETELKAGIAVKMDKTGKSILMLLRHLGRLAEVRAVLDGMGSVTAYVLQPPT